MTGIYMAGPIAEAEDGGAGWRDTVRDCYPDIQWHNPLDKYNVPGSDVEIVDGQNPTDQDGTVSVGELVRGDKMLLDAADAVLVGHSCVRSVGTPMEVMWAYERDMPIAIWVRDDTSVSDLSPWYRHHAGFVSYSADDAVDYLLEQR